MIKISGVTICMLMIVLLYKREIPIVYNLIFSVFVGAFIGGLTIEESLEVIGIGARNMIPFMIKILAEGIFAGVLIESGATYVISKTLTNKLGEFKSILVLVIIATFMTSMGVYVDIAVLMVAPMTFQIAKDMNWSRFSAMLAIIGGGKIGNILSPHLIGILISKFNIKEAVIIILVSIFILIITTIFIFVLVNVTRDYSSKIDYDYSRDNLPTFFRAISAPIISAFLLILNSITPIYIYPAIALSLGGIIGYFMMRKICNFKNCIIYGLNKMSSVIIMLIGAGALSNFIINSELFSIIINCISSSKQNNMFLATLSGISMSFLTSSSKVATYEAIKLFESSFGITFAYEIALISAGSIIFDNLLHGTFFYATAVCAGMNIKERLKLIPFEFAIAIVVILLSTLIYSILFPVI